MLVTIPLTAAQIDLKTKYKFRLILDETSSFGVLGRTARGLTEHQNVDPLHVDMIIGSLAGPLCAGGGFCAGSAEIVEHQRISAASYTFSAALPAMLATTASEVLAMLGSTPGAVAGQHPAATAAAAGAIAGEAAAGITAAGGQDILAALRDNIRTMWAQLDPRSDWVRCTSCPENPVMILVLKDDVIRSKGWEDPGVQEAILQDIVDECLNQGVLITRVKRMPGFVGVGGSAVTKTVAATLSDLQNGSVSKSGKTTATTPSSSKRGSPVRTTLTAASLTGGGSGVGGTHEGDVRPALKVCLTVGLARREVERAGTTIRHAVTKVVKARK